MRDKNSKVRMMFLVKCVINSLIDNFKDCYAYLKAENSVFLILGPTQVILEAKILITYCVVEIFGNYLQYKANFILNLR